MKTENLQAIQLLGNIFSICHQVMSLKEISIFTYKFKFLKRFTELVILKSSLAYKLKWVTSEHQTFEVNIKLKLQRTDVQKSSLSFKRLKI